MFVKPENRNEPNHRSQELRLFIAVLSIYRLLKDLINVRNLEIFNINYLNKANIKE